MTALTLLIAPVGGLLIAGFLVWFTRKPRNDNHHPAE